MAFVWLEKDYNLFLCCCCAGSGYIVTLTKVPQWIKYIILEFTPFLLSFISPFPHSWNSFNRYYFLLLYQCVDIFCTVFTQLSKGTTGTVRWIIANKVFL
jgi:hypothetical protein